jgi:hypothetical protein
VIQKVGFQWEIDRLEADRVVDRTVAVFDAQRDNAAPTTIWLSYRKYSPQRMDAHKTPANFACARLPALKTRILADLIQYLKTL